MKAKKHVELPNSVNCAQELFLAVAVMEDGKEDVVCVIEVNDGDPIERATKADRDAILRKCKEYAEKLRKKIRVVRFSHREVIAEIEP